MDNTPQISSDGLVERGSGRGGQGGAGGGRSQRVEKGGGQRAGSSGVAARLYSSLFVKRGSGRGEGGGPARRLLRSSATTERGAARLRRAYHSLESWDESSVHFRVFRLV